MLLYNGLKSGGYWGAAMIIDVYFDEFISSKSLRYDTDLRKTAKTLLKGNKPYSLTQMPGFEESE